MRIFSGLQRLAWLALGLTMAVNRLEAQLVAYRWSAIPSPILVSNTLTYTVILTNLDVSASFRVTNTLTGTSFAIGTATTSQGSSPVTGSNYVVFPLGTITNRGTATMVVQVVPTSVGSLTNTVDVVINEEYFNYFDIPVQVTNDAPVADLAVAVTGPSSQVYSNDWMVYSVNVTNLGPASATNVYVTNSLPAGVGFKSVSPALPRIGLGRDAIFNLGVLTNGEFVHLHLTVQPTNAGTLELVSVISTNTMNDLNPANNRASISVTVSNLFSGQLVAVTNSPQTTNFQNGFIEQTIRLTNLGTNDVDATRVMVTGLKTNRLYNAVGTNNGNPFVVYNARLTNNQGVNLLLQYAVTNRAAFPFTNSQLQAYGVALLDLQPPPATVVSPDLIITRLVRRANGSVLLEWPSVTNRTYTVVYSDEVTFANAMIAPPSIVAPADRTQWIDYGPPTTTSHPTNAPARFYRVFLNP
jgi:uncharacterized repeat protein (TIGR01451 family)